MINYHKHSEYSNLSTPDSVTTVKDYAKRAVELKQNVISTCEHGWQGPVWEYYKAARDNNLKLLVGAEAYWVRDRFEKDGTNAHIWLGAKNENGRQAINDILSEANLSGFYRHPRIDIPIILSLPKDDIWCTTACVAFWKYDDSDDIVKALLEHFGENFYLEVQNHNTPKQIELNKRILSLHDELKIPIVAGLDSHYIYPEDSQKRSDFLVSKGIEYEDEESWYMDYPSEQEIYSRFAKQCVLSDSQIREAIANTDVFEEVEEYDSPIFNSNIKMPTLYPEKTQEERDSIYKNLVWFKWGQEKKNIPENDWPEYESEIQKEIDTVVQTHMSDYFIDNYHIIKKGKENGGRLTKSGRGSAVSFYTNKLLGFTEVDRISAKVKMYPERFMSITRILGSGSLPDVDFNCADVAPFVQAQKDVLGDDHAYPMVAYGTAQKSAAWKLYAKAQNVPFEIANEVSEQLKKYELAVKHAKENDEDPDDIDVLSYIGAQFKDIYSNSKDYQGLITSWSIAPCSHLLYQGSIRKEIGLVKVKDNICCLMDGHWAEECHFLKNDMLKVSVWDLIYRAFDKLQKAPPTVTEMLAMCDPRDISWKLYEKGCTLSVNQVEQKGTSSRVSQYKPKNISELCAFVAAIRPGFKSMYKVFESRKPFSYGVKDFDELIQTEEMPNSFILYQEMEMAVLNYAGIDMSECYTAIKNIAKKRVDKVLSYKEKFIESMTRTMIAKDGMDASSAQTLSESLWQVIEDSSQYSFNACVSGDTKLQWMAENNKYHPTIEEMFFIKNSSEYANITNHTHLHKKYLSNGYGTALSMFEDGRIRKNKIVDISFAGVRPIYRVETETGEHIDCTLNHKFPTPEGIKELGSLHVGDSLYVKGDYEKCRNKYSFTGGNYKSNVPIKGQKGFQRNPNGDSVVFNNAREKHIEQQDCCSCCGKPYKKDERFELHHSDFDRTNNNPSNYEWLCVSCHKKKHFERGRTTVFQKGLLTKISKIKSIAYLREDRVYDICMNDPAHTIVSESGLVASNSHSYCVALDSLYCAWLKMHHPLEFYTTAIEIQSEKGNKDKINELKEEAESYFNIQFPLFKYGQDNRSISFDIDKNAIYNSIDSIKGFGKAVGEALYESSKEQLDSDIFFDLLRKLDAHGIKSSKVIPLIKIGYFDHYGSIPELMDATRLWDDLKQGSAKQLSASIMENDFIKVVIEEDRFVTNKNAKGKELKTYTIVDMDGLLCRLWYLIKATKYPDLSYKVIAANQMDVLGYIDLTTGKEEDRRKLYVMEEYSLQDRFKGGIWKYCVKTKSLGSGKISTLNIAPNLYTTDPIREGDIVYVDRVAKDLKGFWNLLSYQHIY